MRGVSPARGGGVTVNLSARERDLLRSLPDQLRPLLTGDIDAPPVTARLFSRGYEDDELEREFRSLIGDDIVRQRVGALDVFVGTLDGGTVKLGRWRTQLDAEQANAWLSAVNDGRLVLGAVLGIVDESHWEEGPTDDDPATVILHYLGWLEEELVQALSTSLPDE
jgi:Domain of unknown function (DUF2017)